MAVLPVNPCDPLDRPANYPTIWLLPSHLGLGQSSTAPFAVAMAILFFVAALVVIPQAAGVLEGGAYGLALCSPSVMLGVERGNVDLLVFVVVVASILLLRRHGRITTAGPSVLLFAAILKLFPILASVVIVRFRERRAWLLFGAVITVFVVYALATLDTIREIRRVVPQTSLYSYGIKPFGNWAHNLFSTYGLHLAGAAFDWLLIVTAAVVALVARPHLQKRHGGDDSPSVLRDVDFFTAGVLIYVGTFFLFQNFEYRLVFLLLAMPQLFRWMRAGSALGIGALLLMLLTLWLGAPWSGVPVVDTLLRRWEWLTSQRPGFGADQPLSAFASAQTFLAIVLLFLFVAVSPRLPVSWFARFDRPFKGARL
jgi:hypothetical protein